MLSLQGLRTRFIKGAEAEEPLQRIAPLGTPEDLLPIVDMQSASGPEIDVTDAGCIVKPGAHIVKLVPFLCVVAEPYTQYMYEDCGSTPLLNLALMPFTLALQAPSCMIPWWSSCASLSTC